jgi:ATP-dependent RNA helicase RhlE
MAMHGNKNQSQRRRALASFDRGRCNTLVATDVASRGIDVEEITHVINFDAPADRDAYVHRTGRTGRAGASGVAASFVLPEQRGEMRKVAAALGLQREFDTGQRHRKHDGRRHRRPGQGRR